MALLLSTSAFATIATLSSASPINPSPKTTPFLTTKPFNLPSRTTPPKRATHFSLPRVAAPPTPPPTSKPEQSAQTDPNQREEEEEEEFGAEDEFGGESSSSKFSWRDHWYPVSLIEDLDPRFPTPFQLLGRDIVLWNDKSTGEWVAFEDKCAHRLAPLSVGLMKKGTCSVRTMDGHLISVDLVFGYLRHCLTVLKLAPFDPREHDDFDKPEFSTVTIQRDLFYGYDTLMENVSDPSHIDFAHHKVTGRRDRAKPLPFKLDASGPWGFSGANDGNPQISAKFVAPCYYMNKIEIDTKLPIVGDQKWKIWICSFNVPMAPGKTRSIVCSARNFFQFTMPGPAWWQVVPRWHEHWTSNKVYDGDMIVLQGQEKIFLSKSMEDSADVNKQYTKITFIPTQADRLVLAFRNWLRQHGNSQPDWFGVSNQQPLPSTVLSKRQMLDRFEQHTQKCSSCKGAFSAFQTLQKFLIGATVVFCATAGIPSDLQLRFVLAGLALLSAGFSYALHELQKNFVFVDYVHAEID